MDACISLVAQGVACQTNRAMAKKKKRAGEKKQMDERQPYEAAVPFLALSNVWQQVGFTRVDVPGRGAMMLLEQLLALCLAQRGALLLPKEPSIALAFASSPSLVASRRFGITERSLWKQRR